MKRVQSELQLKKEKEMKVTDNIIKNLKSHNIALVYGGNSPEHEVSISSAKGVYSILKKLCKKVYLIGISRSNQFYLQNGEMYDDRFEIIDNYQISNEINPINELYLRPGKGFILQDTLIPLHLVFPVTHGVFGEDGQLQGLLSICNIRCCGCDTAASSICMSKANCSSILNDNGIDTIKTVIFDKYRSNISLTDVQSVLGKNLFIKSETTGSSIGVHVFKSDEQSSFESSVSESFTHSDRVLIQPLYENFKEIECAALEYDGEIVIGGPGTVIKHDGSTLLSYESKYAKVDGAYMDASAPLADEIRMKCRDIAKRAFEILNLKGYARIDFFLDSDNNVILNEINTLPGLTSTSHYPLLIESEGISFSDSIALIVAGEIDG